MNTTNLIVEFLVIGIQVAIWISLLVLIFIGTDWLEFGKVKELGTAIIALLIAISYPIGIFVDNLADRILKNKDKKIRNKFINDEDKSIFRVRTLAGENSPLAELFSYQRMRIRISRSSFLNFSLISFMLPILFIVQFQKYFGSNLIWACLLTLIIGGLFTYLAYWTWKDVSKRYYRRYPEAEKLLIEKGLLNLKLQKTLPVRASKESGKK